MSRDLGRLLAPRTIAVIGGGAWCASVIDATRRLGFEGDIVPIHPSGKPIAGIPALPRLEDWSGDIDAAFVGINRKASIEAVRLLNEMGAGGAVCFASGFSEAKAEDETAPDLQAALVTAAGEMPILGPNCYGFVNALERVAIWPDQHGMRPLDRGVAILTQSSNIAINLTMQRRALPLAMMVTCGNMAQTQQADIAASLLRDDRITAIGLHVEGFGDLRAWERLAEQAHAQKVPLVVLKSGRTTQAQQAMVSHTASLAGTEVGAGAFLDRLGIAQVEDLPGFLETLKLLHCIGPLPSRRVATISCSGGEASLAADLAASAGLELPPLSKGQVEGLQAVLGPMVAVTNPLDYHTYIWRDAKAMAACWGVMAQGEVDLTLSIVDYPHTDAADWGCATEAAKVARADSAKPFAVASTLPELMPEDVAHDLMAAGVVPLFGLKEAFTAIKAAAGTGPPDPVPVLLPQDAGPATVLSEFVSKQALSLFGVDVPSGVLVPKGAQRSPDLGDMRAPFAVKGTGLAHKTEAGAVRLHVGVRGLAGAMAEMPGKTVLVEEMVAGGVAELLVGITLDPAHGYVLTLAAGGVLTEVMQDSISLLVPSDRDRVRDALMRLRVAPMLNGYRGKPPADIEAILDATEALQAYVVAHGAGLSEVEVNPLISTPERAVAADVLIRRAP